MTLFDRPGSFAGLNVVVKDAQQQRRTPRDVPGPWVRPKVPNKAMGRWGTRRMWKRRNAPHCVMLYREPTDAIKFHNTLIVTSQQFGALCRHTIPR